MKRHCGCKLSELLTGNLLKNESCWGQNVWSASEPVLWVLQHNHTTDSIGDRITMLDYRGMCLLAYTFPSGGGFALGDPGENVFVISLARRPEKRQRVLQQLEENQLRLGSTSWCGPLGGWFCWVLYVPSPSEKKHRLPSGTQLWSTL